MRTAGLRPRSDVRPGLAASLGMSAWASRWRLVSQPYLDRKPGSTRIPDACAADRSSEDPDSTRFAADCGQLAMREYIGNGGLGG